MRFSALIAVVVGLLLAGGSVVLASRQFAQPAVQPQPAAVTMINPAPELPTVVVASRAINYGETLKSEMLIEVKWPMDSVPENTFTTKGEFLGVGLESQKALSRIEKGEPIFKAKLSGFGERASIASRLSEGKRAFSIRINDVSGVAGFLLPGDRVDIMLTQRLPSREIATNVILQNITVLGIDQVADTNEDTPRVGRTATVEVDPDQATKLALAMEVGSLSLSLRQSGANEAVTQKLINVDDLTYESKEDKTEQEDQPLMVRIRRGSTVVDEEIGAE
ncbi:MAG: Flp pilus assembly protein CpaB [Rhodobacteraceae bacterium]|nr:Flp pilus assembly protein CpaB [Paracoccaceae bacterium]